jgi:hypothetical protein
MTTQLSALDLMLRTDFARADRERARAAYERAAYDDPMWFERRLLEKLSKAASFRKAKIEIDKLLAERERLDERNRLPPKAEAQHANRC